ncbi:SICAvar type I [Plasmodium knowlesi]|uniref:SICAvar, type I n=4 Tax=Plasmodium knowlesi TaxID=5850 RepID=A0A1A7W2U0_PLAKH|nr:SICAvar type I [Plasmodium knowlesi]SBO28511.1 SICAvar, type I [Plasmodium knowlesi strain H]
MAGKFAGVLAEWYKSTGKNGDAYVKLEKEMKDTFEELGNYLKGASDPTGVAAACSRVPERYWVYTGRSQDKLLCKALLRVVYWMNGLDEWARSRSDGANEKELKEYLRCIIGHAAMIRLLSNKCQVVDIVQAVQKAQANVAGIIDKENLNKKCGWVTLEHMKFSSKFLGKTLVEWVNEQNRAQGWSSTYINWTMCPKKGTWDHGKIEEEKDKSKGILDLVKEKKARELHEKVYQQGSSTSPGSPASAVDPTSPVGPTSPHGSPTASEDILEQFLQNAESCKAEEKDNMQNCLRKKLDLTIGKPCGDSSSNFCSRVDCILKKKKEMNDSSTGKTVTENKVREEIKTEVTSFDSALSNNAARDNDIEQYCKDVPCTNGEEDCVSKETCKIIVKALRDIHQIKKEGSDSDGKKEINRIFKSTIHCMALNAFIHKLKDQADKGGYVCAVEDGIEKAFGAAEKERDTWCNKNGKGDGNEKGSCEECGKDNQCFSTDVGGMKPWTEVMKNLNNDTTPSIQPTLEELHNQATLCDRLHCAIDQWKIAKGITTATAAGPAQTQINDNDFWDKDVKKLWEELAGKMKDSNGKDASGNGQCDSFTTDAEKAACNYLHAGFTELYKDLSSSKDDDNILKNNPSFRQTMGCFLLHAYAKHMKEKAICNIEKGIEKAFDSWQNPGSKTGTSCNGAPGIGKGPCVPCQWNEKDKLDSCLQKITINSSTTGSEETAKKKVEKIIEEDTTNIKDMLSNINKRDKLCEHMKCIATHLNSTNGQPKSSGTTADNFWKDDVKNLWKELAGAMAGKGSGDGNGNGCNKVKDGNNPDRDAIHSEKTACNYLHAGFKKLKELSRSIRNDGTNYATLKKDPSFVQTVGCFLLHSYAKHMQKESTCVIDAGIERAFSLWQDPSKKASSICNGSGTEPCVPCKWNESDYDTCQIKTNGGTGTTEQTAVKPEVEGIVKVEDSNTNSIIKNINEMKTLCDGLQCIASHLNPSNGKQPSTTAEEFWKVKTGEVHKLWTELSTAMKANEKDEVQCNTVDNGTASAPGRTSTNPERKACNYLHAGLNELKTISTSITTNGTSYPILSQHASFGQTMGCLFLKEYAKKMQEKSTCVVDSGLRKAFKSWNESTNGKCSNGSCVPCNWDETLDNCNVTFGNTAAKVQDEVDPILTSNEENMKIVTENINEMITLCDYIKCAAPKWLKEHSNGGGGSGTPTKNLGKFWEKNGEVEELWNQLAQAMRTNTKSENKCNQMDNENREATNPEKKACNYLHAGLTELYKKTTPSSTTLPSGNDEKILDKNPLLKQTVGCLLLHAYAKKMKSGAKCLVESGIKKAFDTAGKGPNGKCTNDSSCIECKWDENYDNCTITLNGSTNETPDKKLEKVKSQIEDTFTTTTKNINLTPSLCDQLKCAAPQWFHNQNQNKLAGNSGSGTPTPTKSWCDFWGKDGVKSILQKMFNDIEKNGKDPPGTGIIAATCQGFGDGNPQSVERKACNHIAEGLKYIKNIKPNGTGVEDKQLLERAVACIALNMYADKIITESKDKCPIDNERIKKMFDNWNLFNNNNKSCPTSGGNDCFVCDRVDNKDFKDCELSVSNTLVDTTTQPKGDCNTKATEVKTKMDGLLNDSNIKMKTTLNEINKMNHVCTKMQCAVKQYHKSNNKSGTPLSWDEISGVVNDELRDLLEKITNKEKWEEVAQHCNGVGSTGDNDGEKTAKQKACKLFASGLKHISDIKDKSQNNNQDHEIPLKQTMMCAALNLYADQLISKSEKQCPLDGNKLADAIKYAFSKSKDIMGKGTPSCSTVNGVSSCFECKRYDQNDFANCQIGNNSTDKVGEKMTELLLKEDKTNANTTTPTMDKTLDKINSKDIFCTELQCAIKQHYAKKIKNGQAGGTTTPYWDALEKDINKELAHLLKNMTEGQTESDVVDLCKDNDKWDKLGHKERKTNKAACLLFASGLKHIYNQHKGSVKGPVKGPSFEQTMGCLFLKEYAKQLKEMANEKKRGHSWVHPLCDIDKGIKHAFSESEKIMKSVLDECSSGPNGISCFVCTQNNDYNNCKIGDDNIGNKAKDLFKGESEQNQMQQTLENTVCPILLTDLLTPFLPLAPVSIGLSAMAYYLWKYFGPLGKGGSRFRRSPVEIPGPSVQEQVLDHVEEAGPHEYRLVKERKPRSAPTRTKRSGPVNRRTIIEIHFEVLDECQKGDTQLNQKDFLELLVQEFMGSELMEEEQVSKEDVFMEGVPLERVPMESVPSLGSVFMV